MTPRVIPFQTLALAGIASREAMSAEIQASVASAATTSPGSRPRNHAANAIGMR